VKLLSPFVVGNPIKHVGQNWCSQLLDAAIPVPVETSPTLHDLLDDSQIEHAKISLVTIYL